MSKTAQNILSMQQLPPTITLSLTLTVCSLPRDEYNAQFGEDTAPLVLARTDAAKTDSFEEAIRRCLAFQEAGCDMTFLEAPEFGNGLGLAVHIRTKVGYVQA